MDWTDISIRAKIADMELCEAIAQMMAPYGIQTEDYSMLEQEVMEIAHIDLIDEQLLEADRNSCVIHILLPPDAAVDRAIDFLQERFFDCGISADISARVVKEESWADAWKQYYHPLEIGEKLLIVPSWEDCESGSRVKVILDPGMAFGTGSHRTTQLCLELLENYIDTDSTVLDIGAGSGILSIAANRLGARLCHGVDIDQNSVKVARENAARNFLGSESLEFFGGDITADTAIAERLLAEYSVITMNIVADTIIFLADTAYNYLQTGGVLITSGIIENRAGEVQAALADRGFKQLLHTARDGWSAMVFTK